MNVARAFTLKDLTNGELQLSWILLWYNEGTPTHADFKAFYGDEFYEPFHKDEKIVELTEKL